MPRPGRRQRLQEDKEDQQSERAMHSNLPPKGPVRQLKSTRRVMVHNHYRHADEIGDGCVGDGQRPTRVRANRADEGVAMISDIYRSPKLSFSGCVSALNLAVRWKIGFGGYFGTSCAATSRSNRDFIRWTEF